MKKMILGLVATAILGFAQPSSAFTAIGQVPCGMWIREKPPAGGRPNTSRVAFEGWLMGFLSGVAAGSDVDFLSKVDPESLILWMDNYCQASPLQNTGTGGMTLTVELMKKKANDKK